MEGVFVEEIKDINKGNLKAFVTVTIERVTIKGFRIVQQPGKKAWVSVPQQEWTDNKGERRYSNIIELPDDLLKHTRQIILDEWGQE